MSESRRPIIRGQNHFFCARCSCARKRELTEQRRRRKEKERERMRRARERGTVTEHTLWWQSVGRCSPNTCWSSFTCYLFDATVVVSLTTICGFFGDYYYHETPWWGVNDSVTFDLWCLFPSLFSRQFSHSSRFIFLFFHDRSSNSCILSLIRMSVLHMLSAPR